MLEITVHQGDITKIKADAIVNAANTSLLGGGGVDGAIHRAGGPEILEECRKVRNRQGGCKVGEAVLTTAGKLNAQFVIHTVGPKWNNGQSTEADKLKNCYLNVLKIAEQQKLKTIAFPNISTGIYGYPKKEAAQVAISTVKTATLEQVEEVIFVCYDDENFKLYRSELGQE